MKKSHIVLFLAALSSAWLISTAIGAAGRPAQPPPPPNPNQTPRPNNTPAPEPTTIKSIDASSITITGPKKKTLTYKITRLTEIDLNGERAKVTDLKPGMRVDVTVGLDPTEADCISADKAPKKK